MDQIVGFMVIVILYVVIGLMAAADATFIVRKILAPKAEQMSSDPGPRHIGPVCGWCTTGF
jgi:hypothetical protein